MLWMAHREGTEMKSGTQDQRSKALSWLLSSCIRKRHMGHSLSPGSWRAWSHMQSVQHTSGSVCACQPGTKGLLCPALCHAGTEGHWDCVGPLHPDAQTSGADAVLVPVKNPCEQPFYFLLCGRGSGNCGQKRCKWHGFRQLNPCSATAFSLKVVILYTLACYLISSALKSSSRRFLNHSGEGRQGVSRLLALEYLKSPSWVKLKQGVRMQNCAGFNSLPELMSRT